MLREQINDVLKGAMKAKEPTKVSTLRLINAAIKDRDIAERTKGGVDEEGIDDDGILQLLQSMIKQRRDSIEAYKKGGRPELADREAEEIDVIQDFLPEQLSDDELAEAVNGVVDAVGAESLKEMGAVMAKLREDYAGQMDFGKASAIVKPRLG
ncbi:MAG: GatB/YqeY domain-containing protein [Rhodospirillaceae bacterium]|nr:GatB/YqeY domain-containing protein [Rhodospirillaceae bacterium]